MKWILKDMFISRRVFTVLFVGFLLAILPIRVALSTQTYFDDLFYESLNGHFRYYYSLEIKDINQKTLQQLQNNATSIFVHSSVITNEFTVNDPDHGLITVIGMMNNKIWSPPLLEGAGIASGKPNAIVVGRTVSDHLGSLHLLDKEYAVAGIAGKKFIEAYNLKAYMNFNELPDSIMQEIKRTKHLQLWVRSNQNPEHELTAFTSEITQHDPTVKTNLRNDSDMYEQAKHSQDMVKEILSYLYQLCVIALINCIIFSYLWIYLKRKSIALRRALGASNFSLFVYVISQLLLCAALATICAIFTQWILSHFSSEILTNTGYFINAGTGNFMVAILVTFAVVLITSTLPVLHILKIQPAKALKE